MKPIVNRIHHSGETSLAGVSNMHAPSADIEEYGATPYKPANGIYNYVATYKGQFVLFHAI